MAMIHGRGGSVDWGTGGDFTYINSWSAEANCDMAETTHMSDVNYWKQYLPGFKDWTATANVNSNQVNMAGALGMSDVLHLEFVNAGSELTGKAWCTGFGVGQDKDGIPTIDFTFQGSGALTFA